MSDRKIVARTSETAASIIACGCSLSTMDPADARDVVELAEALSGLSRSDLKAIGRWLFWNGAPVHGAVIRRVMVALDASESDKAKEAA